MRQVGTALLRTVVDEPDEVDPVLRVLKKLATDELPDIARADDDGVLDVGRSPPANGSGGRATAAYRHDGGEPEEAEPPDVWMRSGRHPREDEEEPRPDRDHVKDRQDFVDSRVVGAFLVAGIKTVRLRHHDPGRDRRNEDECFAVC